MFSGPQKHFRLKVQRLLWEQRLESIRGNPASGGNRPEERAGGWWRVVRAVKCMACVYRASDCGSRTDRGARGGAGAARHMQWGCRCLGVRRRRAPRAWGGGGGRTPEAPGRVGAPGLAHAVDCCLRETLPGRRGRAGEASVGARARGVSLFGPRGVRRARVTGAAVQGRPGQQQEGW